MTARPNYRYANARCCATCANRHTDWFNDRILCVNRVEFVNLGDAENLVVQPDHICDDYKSEVQE